jgi:hypothetical protein|tara:strand:+ start:1395 stop:2000 length:606 start_codon:yes stop_codon:yes gene_type:complete
MASSLTTTLTLSSTDISSDTLSFSVSETLSLTGSGGLKRFNIDKKYTGSSEEGNNPLQFSNLPKVGALGVEEKVGYELYAGSGSKNASLPGGITGSQSHTPTYLYLKNITGSGFSASAGGPTTSSNVHLFMSGSGNHNGGSTGSYDIAVLKQGSFLYIPINPNTSYYVYTPTGSGNLATNTNDIGYGAGLTGTIIEYAVFK